VVDRFDVCNLKKDRELFLKRETFKKRETFEKRNKFKKDSVLKKMSKRGDDYIFPLREDRHPQANIESSPLTVNFF